MERTRSASMTLLLLAMMAVGRPTAAAEPPAVGLLAKVAPADSVLCLELPDIRGFGQALNDTDVLTSLRKSPLAAAALGFIAAGRELAAQYLGGTSADEWAAQAPNRWVFLVFDIPPEATDLDRPGVLVVGQFDRSSTGLKSLWRERMLPRLKELDNTLKAESQEYKGITVDTVQKPGDDPLAIAFTETHVLLGLPKAVTHFVDTQAAKGQVLADQEGYKYLSQRFAPGPVAALFADLRSVIQKKLADLPRDCKEARDMRLLGTSGLQGIGGTCHREAHGFRDSIFLDMGDAAGKGLLGLFNTRQPRVNRSAALVPKDYALHLALAVTSGVDLMEGIRALVVDLQGETAWTKVEEGFQFLNTAFTIDIKRDIIAQIGGEIFAAVKPLGLEQVVEQKRKPQWGDFDILIGLEVKDATSVRDTLKRLIQAPALAQQGFSLAEETYQDVTLYVVQGFKNGPPSRAYAFLDGFIIIAQGTTSLKPVVDTLQAKSGLASKPGYLASTSPYADPAVASLYVNLGPAISQLLPKLMTQGKPGLQPLAPVLTEALAAGGEMRVVALPSPQGLSLVGDFDLPLGTVLVTAACADHLGKPMAERRANLARERMKQIGQALRKYHRRNQVPPDSLLQLVPHDLQELPQDPFSEAAPFGYGVATGGTGWILTSVGPDGKRDVDVDSYSPEKWQALISAWDETSVAAAKSLVYQFRSKRYADEKAPDDEGDIVETGTW